MNLTMEHFGFHLSESEAYMHEGRTGASPSHPVEPRARHDATPEEIEEIYGYKSMLFNACPPAEPMQGANDVIAKVKASGLTPYLSQEVATFPARQNQPQLSQRLLARASRHRLRRCPREARSEPYRMDSRKAATCTPTIIIIENAPLGVEAA
jgi:hypothetical protein